MCDWASTCPVCGDRLIHQANRGRHESSSAYGQHIHDVYPVEFDAIDLDIVIRKSSTRIVRAIEHKPQPRPLSPAQQRVLPLIATGFDHAIVEGRLAPESGVFLVASSPPFDGALVQRVVARRWLGETAPWSAWLSGDLLRAFETGLSLDELLP